MKRALVALAIIAGGLAVPAATTVEASRPALCRTICPLPPKQCGYVWPWGWICSRAASSDALRSDFGLVWK